MKRCSSCDLELPIEAFYRDRNRPDGRYPSCRKCRSRARSAARKSRTDDQSAADQARARAYYLANREETLERQRSSYEARRPQHQRSSKNRYLKRTYGITLADYETMLEAQGGTCAVCDQPEHNVDPRRGKTLDLAVDHDHQTGRVRALLCRACNVSLGLLRDDPERLRALASYLERHAWPEVNAS